jgi:hypothetical protein
MIYSQQRGVAGPEAEGRGRAPAEEHNDEALRLSAVLTAPSGGFMRWILSIISECAFLQFEPGLMPDTILHPGDAALATRQAREVIMGSDVHPWVNGDIAGLKNYLSRN